MWVGLYARQPIAQSQPVYYVFGYPNPLDPAPSKQNDTLSYPSIFAIPKVTVYPSS